MAKDYTSTTFSDDYKDDFDEVKGFHKVLFNSGRPIQARELTQLQTILQEQISKFASNIFLDGAAVGASGADVQQAQYVILEQLPSGITAESYRGVTLRGPASSETSGLEFFVVHAEEATDDGDFPTLYGIYKSANQSAISNDIQLDLPTFEEENELQDVRVLGGGIGAGSVTVRTQPGSSQTSSTGKGLLFGTASSTFYAQGHFVYADKQLITISKYTTIADVDVGFEVIQDIVSVDDDESLFDNQGLVPNLSSPGADRFRIRLNLTTRGSVADPARFVFYASVRDGEIVQVKSGSESYNEVEKRLAVRHFDTHGNFIVNAFDVRYTPGDSSSVLNLNVSGNVNGNTPTAFLDGYRLIHPENEKILIEKPTSKTTEEAQATSVAYRNYANVAYDSASTHMGGWTNSLDVPTQKKVSLMNGSTVIGNGRIKQIINTLDDSEGYRVHFYDVKMKEGQNARDVEVFAPYDDLASTVPLKQTSGQLYFTDPEINTSLFEVPGGRCASVYDLNFTVQRQFTATSNSGGVISITTGNNEAFDDVSRWVFINTTTGREETVVPSNISRNSATPQTAVITVSGISESYIIYAYVEKNRPQPKIKTYSTTSYLTSTLTDDSEGSRFKFDIYDGIDLVEARMDSANGRLITDQVQFDGGQRDNYYGPVSLKPSGLSSGVTTVVAKFRNFEWSSNGDYFSVNSYDSAPAGFGYADIPTFVSPRDGETYDMRNHIDFRSKLDPYANVMSATDRFELPRDGDNVSYDVQWYNRRVDNISLGYNPNDFSTEIRINKGVEALSPEAPSSKVAEMTLFRAEYGGNTLDIKDISVQRMRHKRYRMSDISKLEDRVETLEETVSLSFLEQEAANLVELNSSGEVRSKTGFFVDDFKNYFEFTASMFDPFWTEDDNIVGQSLYSVKDFTQSVVGPKTKRAQVQMSFDSDNIHTGRSGYSLGNMVRKGDLMYLDYKDVLDSSLSNTVISWYSDGRSSEEQGWYNVNPFNVFTGEGFMKLSPATDQWNDTYRLPDRTVYDEEITIEGGTQYSNRRKSGEITPTQPPGTNVDKVEETIRVYDQVNSIDEDVIAYAVPFSRQREIFGKVQGLRPETRYWPFFDGVNVEQWTIAETETEYKSHLAANDHLRGYPEVDVTVKKHPRKSASADSTLISDYKGDLFFSFWLPNNAPVPTPQSNEFSSIDEWNDWIDAQRKAAEEYPGGSEDPQVYDDIGWKFRSGTIEFLLNDVSTNKVENGLSNARTLYVSSGSLNVSQKTVHMTRVTEKSTMIYVDPLAQTFMIDGREGLPGAFVTKVDVYIRNAPQTANRGGTDLGIPLQLQVREVENGIPVGYPAGEQFRVYKGADEVYDVVSNISNKTDLDDVLSNPVTFEFPEPIYLQANEEYAIVLLAECDDYEAFISTTYGLVLGKTEERVNAQPATGSLFLSQNGSTWTPRQDQNLAYRIHTAKFKQEGTFNLFNEELQRYRHNTPRLSVDESDYGRFRVNHVGHNLGVGDKPHLTGLDSNSEYFGILGSTLMDSNNVVDSADVAGYFIDVNGTFGEAGWFGADSVTTGQGFNYDRATYNVTSQEYPNTSIEYVASLLSGVSHSKIEQTAAADPRFDYSGRNRTIYGNKEIFFTKPKYIANADQEVNAVSPKGSLSSSVIIGTKFRTDNVSTFGGPTAANIAVQGYVSDVSPILDLQRSMFVAENYLIDNQPLDSSGASELSNTPFYYIPETHPTLGSSPSKHITKPVILNQAANGIKVFIDMFNPEQASVDVYFRTTADPDEDIYEKEFVLVTPQNDVPSSPYNPEVFDMDNIKFSEYRYLIGGEDGNLEDFTKFQLKLVMKSTNTCEIPYLKSVRAIALI